MKSIRDMDLDGIVASERELLALRGHGQGAKRRPRGPARTLLAGAERSAFRGRGMDFEEFRVYQPGDDPRTIDWNVSARRGKTYTKVFNEERERPALFFVDCGPSMRFGTRGAFKSVAAARAAARLVWQALDAGERVGGLVWDGTTATRVAPSRGRRSAMKLVRALARATSAVEGGERSAASLLALLDRMTPTGAAVHVFSDFYDLSEEGRARLGRLARRSELSCWLVLDPLEEAPPPPGQYRWSDGRTTLSVWSGDEPWRASYTRELDQRREALRSSARRAGARVRELRTDEDVKQAVASFSDAGRLQRSQS